MVSLIGCTSAGTLIQQQQQQQQLWMALKTSKSVTVDTKTKSHMRPEGNEPCYCWWKYMSFLGYDLLLAFSGPVGLVVKASESGRSRVRIPLAPGFFRGRVVPVTSKLALQWLPCQAPGVIGSALGLVGPVSVYCDRVRWKV